MDGVDVVAVAERERTNRIVPCNAAWRVGSHTPPDLLAETAAGEPARRQGAGSVGQYLARSSGVSVSCGSAWKAMMLWITFGYCTAGAMPTFQ